MLQQPASDLEEHQNRIKDSSRKRGSGEGFQMHREQEASDWEKLSRARWALP